MIQVFTQDVNEYVSSLRNLAVDDLNWTDFLLKLCILCNEVPQVFDSLRNNVIRDFNDSIAVLFKRNYRAIIEDKNILKNFTESQGLSEPAK